MIHPTAIIAPSAEIGSGVKIGAYSIVGENVKIGENCEIGAHVVIHKWTTIGKNNCIFSFASLGADPQDKKYGGEETWLEIGDNNTIREFVTFNRGTIQDGGVTRIGNNNWIMANVHLAHDCHIGNNTVFANNASLAGHVHIEDNVIMGGYALVYQFVKIGELSMVAFSSGVKQNVPPFSLIEGMPANIKGINAEGLKRHNFTESEIKAIKEAHHALYHENLLLSEARERISNIAKNSESVAKILAFLANIGKRGLIR